MKYFLVPALQIDNLVAPREGAWVEILGARILEKAAEVAPREGAWVEI